MNTNSNIDFDRLEKMLRAKRFEDLNDSEKQWIESILSEVEYTSMWMMYTSLNELNQGIEIEPQAAIKEKLNKAIAANKRSSNIFQLKMPVYQSVAAALLVFMVGIGINLSRPVEKEIIYNKVHVIKYILKPEKVNKMAVETNIHTKKKLNKISPNTEQGLNTQLENIVCVSELNPEIIRLQEFAATNFNRMLNETNGSNLEGDSVLQKMQVTVF